MYFGTKYTPEHEKFRQEVRQWLDANAPQGVDYPPEMEQLDEKTYALALEFRRRLAEKCWLFPNWPKEYGGGGLSPIELDILEEEFLKQTLPIVYDLGGILGPALLAVGTEKQKKRFLPLMAMGKIIVWQCFTEPEAGTDLASLQLRATKEGNEFVLNGQKTYAGDEHRVDYLYLPAISDPKALRHQNMTAFVVKADSLGISMTGLKPLAGPRKNTVYFENVRVPMENVIGEVGKGWQVINISLGAERAGWGAHLRLDVLFDEFVKYCKETKRNGKPLASDPHVQQVLADLYIDVKLEDMLVQRNMWRRNKQLPVTYEGSQSALHMKLLKPKLAAVMLEIAGPAVLVSDKRLALIKGKAEYMQRQSLMTHGGGTPEAQKIILARALGLGRKRITPQVSAKQETAT